jgi:hypothetical protein
MSSLDCQTLAALFPNVASDTESANSPTPKMRHGAARQRPLRMRAFRDRKKTDSLIEEQNEALIPMNRVSCTT